MLEELEGTILAEKYRVERKVGEGGMGVVYAAEQLSLQRRVALKLLHYSKDNSEAEIAALLREARILSRVEHPAIVRVIDASRTGAGRPFLVFEYLEGCTLKRLLDDKRFLPWRWSVRAMVQVLAALTALHREDIVHGDIKPSNCFCLTRGQPLEAEPQLKLIDFGIAQIMSDPSTRGSARTPGYCAPEQASGGEAHFLSDVYALGVTLYEMLSGELPERSDAAGLAAPRAPSAVNPGVGIPAELDDIVLRAVEYRAEQRFQSAAEMQQALSGLLSDPAEPRTQPSSERAQARAKAGAALPNADETQLKRLRAKVERFWISGVLDTTKPASLASQQWTLRRDLLGGGLASEFEPGPPLPLRRNHSIFELFNEYEQSLLLVAAPGIGKTTQLLLLAQALLQSGGAVPVIFVLSSWTAGWSSLTAWLEAELHSKYQVPKSLASDWLASGRILPLLDGLDEVAAGDRGRCVAAINAMLASGLGFGVAITSRFDEYHSLPVRLHVNGVVQLGELTHDSAKEFIERHLPQSDAKRLIMDAELVELARSPLVLSLLASLATTSTTDSWLRGPEEGRDRFRDLLELYVRRTLVRAGKRRLPCAPERFIGIVEQLAYVLKRNNQTIFQLDGLQPSYLTRRDSLFAYALTSRVLAAILLGASLVLALGRTPLHNMGFHADLRFGFELASATAFSAGVTSGLFAFQRLRRAPLARGVLAHWLQVLALAVLNGAAIGALVSIGRPPVAGVMGLEIGLLVSPLLSPGPQSGRLDADVNPVEALRFAWQPAWRALPWGALAAAFAAAVTHNAEDPHASWVTALYVLSMWILLAGIRGREVGGDPVPNGAIHRSLRIGAALAAAGFTLTTLALGARYGAAYGSYVGLMTAAALFLWYGGYAVIQHWLLRALLRLEGFEYCNARALDAATERAFLHRVGSGYLFLHALLADYLAGRFERRFGK